jgi:signal transduction histidine kinase
MSSNPSSSAPLRILVNEDSEIDFHLLETEFRRARFACELRRTGTREEFVRALEAFRPDLVLSDYHLPGFNGIAALELTKRRMPSPPLIFLTHAAGEETAVECLHQGAADYVLKKRLPRIVPVIQAVMSRHRPPAEYPRQACMPGGLPRLPGRKPAGAAPAENEQKLLQSQKLEIVGLIASGVAHDFNNLLTAIRGYGELLKDRLSGASGDIPASIDGLLKTTSRATVLVRRLLGFARKQVLPPETIDLNLLVTDLRDLIASFLPPGIRIELKLHPAPVTLVADRNQIEQVLINLAINARDAMPGGGTLTILTTIRELAPGEKMPALRPGSYAGLSVQDTGTGMTDEVKAKIFAPFFTTKEPERGTGLGLPICLNVIRRFHGDLLLKTAPGQGTTFQALLPRDPVAVEPAGDSGARPEAADIQTAPLPAPATADDAATATDAATANEMAPLPADAAPDTAATAADANDPDGESGELIYLVEDDDDIREVTTAILQSLGYRVHAFAAAAAVLAHITEKKDTETPGLLISDIFMPDMDGRKLSQHIGEIHPTLRILFMSGYVDSPALLNDTYFIAKPFTRDTLARKVRLALDARRE